MEIEWDKVIPILVGVFGVILAAFTFYTTRKEKTRRVEVKVKTGFPFSHHTGSGPTVFIIEARNPGDRTVTLTGAGILIPDGKQVFVPDPRNPSPQSDVAFPHELEEGKSCMAWVETQALAHGLKSEGFSGEVKLQGYYKDALGTQHKSKSWKLDIESWLQPA